MSQPRSALYLTDSERVLASTSKRRRYRFRLEFRIRQTYYTRWFPSDASRSDYAAMHAADLTVISQDEATD